jgi:short-subunit dehydrogenase
MSVYYASKAYVLHLSEAIAEEVRDKGVIVSAFCPGPTATGFEKNADMENSRLFSGRHLMSAERAAKIGYRGLWDGKAVVIPGFTNRFFAWATRLPPRSWLPKIARKLQEQKSASK